MPGSGSALQVMPGGAVGTPPTLPECFAAPGRGDPARRRGRRGDGAPGIKRWEEVALRHQRPGHRSGSGFTFACSEHAGWCRQGRVGLCCFLLRETISVHFIETPLCLLCAALQGSRQKTARFVLTLSPERASSDSTQPR